MANTYTGKCRTYLGCREMNNLCETFEIITMLILIKVKYCNNYIK